MKTKPIPTLIACLLISLATLLRAQSTVVFDYTGGDQSYTVPAGVTKVLVKTWGGGGGGGFAGSIGGGGGGAKGYLNVSPGQVLTVRVGGGGRYSSQTPSTWVNWPEPGAGVGVYGDGGDTWVVGCGGQGGGRTEVVAPDGSRLVAGGGGGGSDGNTGYGVLHGDGGGNANYLASGPAGEAGQIATGGGGGGGWVGGAQGNFSRGAGGGQSNVSGSFYDVTFEAGTVWTSGFATDPNCGLKGYGGPSQQDGTAGRVVIAPLVVTSAPEVSASSVNYGEAVVLRPRGSAGAGVSWSENVVWKPNGQAVVLGHRSGVAAITGEINYTPDAGPGVYSYQCRVVDTYQNYADGWVSFTVNPPDPSQWSWQHSIDGNNDIWLTVGGANYPVFDYRLGGGGCIVEIRVRLHNNRALLAPTFQGEQTDRVVMWIAYDQSAHASPPPLYPGDGRNGNGSIALMFNQNQAGTGGPNGIWQFAPALSVHRSPNQVDVYAVPKDQFFDQLNAQFNNPYPCLTRYELQANGVLKVRMVVLLTATEWHNGNPLGNPFDPYIGPWVPAAGDDTFDSMARTLDANGNPTDGLYKDTINDPAGNGTVPAYQAATQTAGYSVIYKQGHHTDSPVLAFVFGTQMTQAANAQEHTLTFGYFGNGLAVGANVYALDVYDNSVLDYTFYLVPRLRSDAAFKATLTNLAASVPAPVIYAPNHGFTGELAQIVSKLRENRNATGTRTDHLGLLSN